MDNHFLQNDQKWLHNTRLIPLKLSSTAKKADKMDLSSGDFTLSKTSQRKTRPISTANHSFIPISEKEWKSVMSEIKVLYLRGDHVQCATRCRLLLQSTKNSFHMDPAYRVYFASYLASSLEITAFTLPNSSSVKLSLYQEALTSYHSAISDLEHALFCAGSAIHTSITTYTSSQLSSARSSVDSVFSQHSKSSSLTSASSVEEIKLHSSGPQGKRKKKVSFCLGPSQQIKHPTGYKDSTPSNIPCSLLDFFPIPPADHKVTVKKRSSFEPAPLNLSEARSLDTSFKANSPNSNKTSHLIRYQNLLSGVSSQINHQIINVQKIIDQITSCPSTSIQENFKASMKFDEEKARRSKEFWPRKRFDGSRYQQLCEKVLSEL